MQVGHTLPFQFGTIHPSDNIFIDHHRGKLPLSPPKITTPPPFNTFIVTPSGIQFQFGSILPPVRPSDNVFIDHDRVKLSFIPRKITTPPPSPQRKDVQDTASNTSPPVDPSGNSCIDHDGVNVPLSPPKITTPPPLPQRNDVHYVQDGASTSNSTSPHHDRFRNFMDFGVTYSYATKPMLSQDIPEDPFGNFIT